MVRHILFELLATSLLIGLYTHISLTYKMQNIDLISKSNRAHSLIQDFLIFALDLEF